MCGIVGLFDTRGQRDIDAALVRHMNDTQRHRGPDESGIHCEPGLAFGHRRLSVIDISLGQQPLANEDGSVLVCYNGEIYNFQQLRTELLEHGHRFRTRSDTEVIVHAWEQWGEACVEHFRGMFAFGLWDRNRRCLFIARDRLGVKPMFYAMRPDGMFAFGSELKSLLALPGLSRTMAPQAIEDYFAYGYIPEPRTIFLSVEKLPPGYRLTQQMFEPLAQPQRYWDVSFQQNTRLGEDEARQELVERLSDAVRMRLIAEVPLGAFLSGGVDSSAVVALMAGISSTPVNTCSIAFADKAYDESPYAAEVARQYGTRHYVQTVDTDDYALIDTLAALYDEPYADSSAIPTYRVCQLARQRVTVALSGDGGDESFAGYRRYRYAVAEERLRRLMPAVARRPLFGVLGKLYPKADWAPRIFRARSTFESLARDLVDGYFHGVSLMSDSMREQLFTPSFRASLQGYRAADVLRAHASMAKLDDPLSLIQYLDIKTYLPGDILTKVDRASMAHALEVRSPLLDHELVEWAATLPPHFKLRGGEGKHIFKRAMAGHLPHNILYRRKQGFAVPLAAWFRGPLRERVCQALTGNGLLSTGIFRSDYLHQLAAQHLSGRRDFSAPIWTLLMFDAFLRKELGNAYAK